MNELPKLCAVAWDVYERTLKKLKPKVTFDIGANEGGMIESLLNHSDSVHAFEPVPDMFQRMSNRWGSNPRVVLNNKAVGDRPHVEHNTQVHYAWALLPANQGHGVAVEYKDKPAFDMEVVTLDDYCRSSSVVPQFIKLDVDGYELRVLKGGRNMLMQHKPPMVFEYSFLPTLLGDSISEMCDLIYQLGYEAVSMSGHMRLEKAIQMMENYPANTSYDIMLLPKGFTA